MQSYCTLQNKFLDSGTYVVGVALSYISKNKGESTYMNNIGKYTELTL